MSLPAVLVRGQHGVAWRQYCSRCGNDLLPKGGRKTTLCIDCYQVTRGRG